MKNRTPAAFLIALMAIGAGLCDAEQTATGAKDIVDLLQQKKIEVKTQGSGIQEVDVDIRRKGDAPVTVKIPVGTFFVSGNKSSQNMVTTSEAEVTLNDGGWHTISATVACANRPRHIPGEKDRFTIQRAPNQKELAKLMPELDKANVSYETRQAAVWIVTDNADYDDMGILQSSRNGVPQGRVITESDAAEAMKICDEAGLGISGKAIWGDRSRILKGIQEGETKQWLQQKIQQQPKPRKR